MGKPNFSDEFKRDAVAQITDGRDPVAEVSQRLGVSQRSLDAWQRQRAKVVSGDASIFELRPGNRIQAVQAQPAFRKQEH